MKKMIIFLPLLFLLAGHITGQEVQKKVEKKVVVVKKSTDKDGKVITEKIEAEGKEADKLIKELKEKGEFDGLDIEIEEKIVIEKENSSSDGKKSKTIKIEVEDDGYQRGSVIMKVMKDQDGNPVIRKMKVGEEDMEIDFDDLIKSGKIGIQYEDADGKVSVLEFDDGEKEMPEVKVRLGVRLSNDNPVTVIEVDQESPAAFAGISSGDIITEINDFYVGNYRGLLTELAKYAPGDEIKVRYIREGKASMTKVKLAGRN